MTSQSEIHQIVQDRYGTVARTGDVTAEGVAAGACCVPDGLYPVEMLDAIPAGAAGISLGCGNPIEGATLQPGETVLDLGSGGGIDCFLAAQLVGASGHVIGVDMTPEMLAQARANLRSLQNTGGPVNYANVEFRQGMIEALPVEDASVDVIISNCVINLAPDKAPVFREMYRVLKPGGRIHVSDMVTNGPMADSVRADTQSWVACIAGALPSEDFHAGLARAGFVQVSVEPDAALLDEFAAIPAGMPYSAVIQAHKRADG
ncbi:MAG: arsenite methyltransferase [Anaerolineales bacterium]